MKLPAQQEEPKSPKWDSLVWFGSGFVTSVLIYAAVVIVYLYGARLFGRRLGEFGKAFAWATVLQLLAAGITVVPASRWRRFGAGLAVGGGFGLILIIAVIALFIYAFEHTKLTF